MYGMFGGCTTLFHLAVKYPLVVLALSLGGFVHQVETNGPGDRMGTDAVLMQAQQEIVLLRPGLTTQVVGLKTDFDTRTFEITEDQVRQVLRFTDSCTDVRAKDVLADPDSRWEAAWLLYLDTYSRHGPAEAAKLFVRQSPITPKR